MNDEKIEEINRLCELEEEIVDFISDAESGKYSKTLVDIVRSRLNDERGAIRARLKEL